MTTNEILKMESDNESGIILVKGNLFLHAYERSAMRFSEQIAPFKITRKMVKKTGCEICYLGFPMRNLFAILNRAGVAFERITEFKEYFFIAHCESKTDFQQWKSSIEKQSVEETKSEILFRETIQKKQMHELTIFKIAYDIMVEIHRFAEIIPRENRYVIGERIRNESIDLAIVCHRIGNEGKNSTFCQMAQHHLETIRLLLRLLVELKQMSYNAFLKLNTNLEELNQQFSLWS